MLPPLDQGILSELSREDEDADSDNEVFEGVSRYHISNIRDLIAKDENCSNGVLRLLELWPRIDPRLYRKKPLCAAHPLYNKGGPNNWWIDFHDHFFNGLRLKPGADGVIDIYAFEKHVQSFRVFGCRQNWPAMILWMWDYGNKLDAMDPKAKARAKAQSDQESMAKPLPVASPEDADLEMEHVDAVNPSCNTILETTTSSEGVGLAPRTKGTSHAQKALHDVVEGVDIGALDIVDHSS